MHYILQWIDRTTMYKVVLYVLSTWVLYAFVLSAFGVLYYTPSSLLVTLIVLLSVGIGLHYVLKRALGAPANVESTLISLVILFFVFDPSVHMYDLGVLALLAAIMVASKYVLAWRHLHLFNPAAVTIVIASLTSLAFSTWWIGTSYFFIPVLLGGLIITQKIRRWPLVLTTVGVGFASYSVVQYLQGFWSIDSIALFFLSWPFIFYATVMVTEPLSAPAGKRNHILYGTLIGILSAIPFEFGVLNNSLALTLLIANITFYPTTLKGRYALSLQSIKEIARDTYELTFTSPHALSFIAGQYLEWALPHTRVDQRGTRRYFTIASAPSEDVVRLGVKRASSGSSYKDALLSMEPGDTIAVTSLDGDFTLPKKLTAQPLVFIAGGIGVTPFRSQIQQLIDMKQPVQATLFYLNKTAADIAWTDTWSEAQAVGVETVYVLDEPPVGWPGEVGRVTPELIKKYVSQPTEALFYLSGPPPMVRAYTKLLKEMGVSSSNIVRDFFPGLA